ncbi:rta1 domain-containing protein [Colletotrichum truncatum]|uniref:Rta1 domain-containing protein n=1 Tax=Colletotrichum truncatum TaxID=5467 RepID=A0ACC3YF48_COLTU|nr:rta1 domain-containing protein [Colletotrichum truncatum]KAF6785011.1 rta1 domain-containing protein [Colletotrichum truncatum]
MPELKLYNGYPLWEYVPSLPAGIVFSVIFGLATAAHAFKLIRNRTWFCIPFVTGGICKFVQSPQPHVIGGLHEKVEVIGYAARAAAHYNTGILIPYVLQSILLLIAPILFAASLYMTLSRIIRAVDGKSCSIVPPRWLTRIFVFGDIFSFVIQSSGAGLRVQAGSGKSNIDPKMGSKIIVGGLVFQIIIFAFYIATAVSFHVKFGRLAVSDGMQVPWKQSLYMLYTTSALIMARNIYRVVEYAMGNDGYLLNHEWPVYVFDAGLMTLTMAAFFWRYPSSAKLSNESGASAIESAAEK